MPPPHRCPLLRPGPAFFLVSVFVLVASSGCRGRSGDGADPVSGPPAADPRDVYAAPEDRRTIVSLYRTALLGDAGAHAHLREFSRYHLDGVASGLLGRFHSDLADSAIRGSAAAADMIRRAVDADDPDGFAALARMLRFGAPAAGMVRDHRAAYAWYERASAAGHDPSALEVCRGALFGWDDGPPLAAPADAGTVLALLALGLAALLAVTSVAFLYRRQRGLRWDYQLPDGQLSEGEGQESGAGPH